MRQKILLSLLIVSMQLSFSYAQTIQSTLINNTWRIKALNINNELFEDETQTCVYSTLIYFNTNNTVTYNIPCQNTTTQPFSIQNNLLILNGLDTLTVSNFSNTSFETKMKQAITDDAGKWYTLFITTQYEKQ